MIIFGIVAFILLNFNVVIPGVDSELKPYVKDFKKTVETVCKPDQYNNQSRVSIKFADLKSPTIGSCTLGADSFWIVIDKDYWNKADENLKYNLIMHELTHCYFAHGLIAAYPMHTDELFHYMQPTISYIPINYIREQLLTFAKERCNYNGI